MLDKYVTNEDFKVYKHHTFILNCGLIKLTKLKQAYLDYPIVTHFGVLLVVLVAMAMKSTLLATVGIMNDDILR